MKLAVLSDIHDQLGNLNKALEKIKKEGIKYAIFCGDYCASETFHIATRNFQKAYCVWGNVDGDRFKITQKVYEQKTGNVILLDQLGEIEIEQRRIAVIHYDNIGERLAQSTHYDAVFHGHTHMARNEKVGGTLLVNPGPVCGYKKGKIVPATYGIYDTNNNSAKIISIK
ncbi:YfcE family phosphodiesterase [Candidatus Woesebacteria bacterium]|nr:YfcE family phosphodiesterase [Candidatus Woesebacteria bacterium]